MKYRKKPVVVDAFHWTGDGHLDDISWLIQATKDGDIYFEKCGTPNLEIKIKTLEGVMTASLGDYIIRGINGEIYPCKPDIFEKTYEPVKL